MQPKVKSELYHLLDNRAYRYRTESRTAVAQALLQVSRELDRTYRFPGLSAMRKAIIQLQMLSMILPELSKKLLQQSKSIIPTWLS